MSTFNNQRKRNGASGDFDLNIKLLKGTADIVLIFALFEVSVKSLGINNKFVVYVNFVEALQRFVRQ